MDTFPSDPDLRHLADLLDLLPGPDNRDFWERVAGRGEPPDDPRSADNVIAKLATHMLALRKANPHPNEVKALVQYLMMFFGGEPRGLHELVGRRFSFVAGQWETVGQLWREDLIATCWRLYVRGRSDRARLEAWPDDFWAWHAEQRREGDHG